MKRLLLICFILLLCLFAVRAEITANGDTIELQVMGEALIIEGDLAKARELAITDGLHQAVEQAVGSLVYSETKVENYELIKDSIRLRSAGYVSGYIIDRVWVEQNICKALLTVSIKQGSIIKDLEELRLNLTLAGNPRVMVAFSAARQGLSTGGIETVMIDGLKKAGFNVVTGSETMTVGERADLLVLGEVATEKLGSYQGLISCRANIELRVLKADTGEVLTIRDYQQTGVDLTATAAAEKALRQAGEKLLPLLINDLSSTLTEPRVLMVDITNISYAQLAVFRRCLQETPMVDAVQLREFQGRKAIMAVETTLSAAQLADELVGWRQFTLEINGVSQHKIDVTMLAIGKP